MVMKLVSVLAVVLWFFALAGTIVFRGSTWANLVLLVVSLGVLSLGLYTLRQKE